MSRNDESAQTGQASWRRRIRSLGSVVTLPRLAGAALRESGPRNLVSLGKRVGMWKKQEQAEEEERIQFRIQMIEGHVAPWRSLLQCLPSTRPDASLPESWDGLNRGQMYSVHTNSVETQHPALRIPEILLAILGFLDPQSQFTAYNVCHGWRVSIEDIIRSKIRSQKPYEPIEYYQPIISDIPELRPSIQELSDLRDRISYLQNHEDPEVMSESDYASYHYPARLSQAVNPELDISKTCEDFWNKSPYRLLRQYPSVPSWLDFSQVLFNPYFTQLFQERLEFKLGHAVLDLVLGHDSVTNSLGVRSQGIYGLIGSMYVTEPPCKVLGIHCEYGSIFSSQQCSCLCSVVDDNGITIARLVEELQKCAPEAIGRWCHEMIAFKRRMAKPYYTSGSARLPIKPRLCIILSRPYGGESPWSIGMWGSRPEHFDIEPWREAFARWEEEKRA